MLKDTCDQCDAPATYWTTRGAWCSAHAGALVIEEDRDEIIRQRDAAHTLLRQCRVALRQGLPEGTGITVNAKRDLLQRINTALADPKDV